MNSIRRRVWFQRVAHGLLMWNAGRLVSSSSALANAPSANGFEIEFPSMGTTMNVRWYSHDEKQSQQVLADAKALSEQWVSVISDYDPQSEAMLVCKEADAGGWVSVTDNLWQVIDICDQWNRWSEGAFDAALGALTRIRRQRKPATDAQWNMARSETGWKHVELDRINHSIRLLRPGVRFDFGAIGKGFVVDRIAEHLQTMGIEQFVVNSSGNMRMGKSPDGKIGWPISIDLPTQTMNEAATELCRLRLSNRGVATSGDRWQRFPDQSQLKQTASDLRESTSHIIDPTTLHGVAEHQSITVIADNATDADAAATATSVRTQHDLPGWLRTLESVKPNLCGFALRQSFDGAGARMLSFGKKDWTI